MFDIPNNPSSTYLIYSLIFLGIFLFISGLNIIKIEKVSVKPGLKTWVIGLILVIAGTILLESQKDSAEMAYICYKRLYADDNRSYSYENCQESTHPCSSDLSKFGVYHQGKELNMALQRCKSNMPFYKDKD